MPVISLLKINILDKLCQDPPDQFAPTFHRLVRIWSLMGCCHGNQFYGKNKRNRLTHLHSSPWHS